MLALKSEGVVGETLNIATGTSTTINEVADLVLEVAGKTDLKVVHSEPRKGDIKHSVADISKARRKLGYDPEISLRDGLEELGKDIILKTGS
jgi:UDP-glucose 4-epimerase